MHIGTEQTKITKFKTVGKEWIAIIGIYSG